MLENQENLSAVWSKDSTLNADYPPRIHLVTVDAGLEIEDFVHECLHWTVSVVETDNMS